MFMPFESGGFGFPCPVALTTVHMATGVVMTNIVKFVRPDLMEKAVTGIPLRQFVTAIVPIGIITATYFSIGNAAYIYLSVEFVQMLKNAGPIAVHLIAAVAGLERITVSSCAAVCIIAAGVCGASVGEIKFHWFGFGLQFTAFILDGFRLVLLKNIVARENALVSPCGVGEQVIALARPGVPAAQDPPGLITCM